MDPFKIKLPKLSWVLGTLFVIIFGIIKIKIILLIKLEYLLI